MSNQAASSFLSHRRVRHIVSPLRALVPLLLFALTLLVLSGASPVGGSALAACTQSGSTVNCTDTLPDPISYTSGVSTLNVDPVTSSTTSISLTGTASNPTSGVTTYTCSPAGNCTIASNSTTCTPILDKDNKPTGTCVEVKAPGGTGIAGPSITVDVNAPTTGPVTIGAGRGGVAVIGISQGSNGGGGSNAYVFGNGGDGGNGANGGSVSVTFTGQIPSASGGGIVAESLGGNGGNGGDFAGIGGSAGSGGLGGAGGNAIANFNAGSIVTTGDGNSGIVAVSRGGNGGSGGHGGGLVYVGGTGSSAGQAGAAEVDTLAGTSIYTSGNYANGIQALSVGGGGGSGSGGFGLFYSGGADGSTGGAGGTATVKANGTIQTIGDHSNGILAQSIGGGGGNAGSVSGAVALGGSGAGGGGGGTVHVENYGSITTSGIGSNAIEAQSIGGGGGNGANSGGLFSMGGNGSGTTTGGSVTVTNDGTLTTYGVQAAGIVAQSIGGGGGNGGTSGGLFAFGGSGGTGADGGTVTVTNGGSIATNSTGAAGSPGILAQSIGGGGGNGGGAVSAGPGLAVAFGGSGAMAGGGKDVTVAADSHAYTINTAGDNSSAIIAQSIGGGGGNGGFAVAASANPIFSVALGTGGNAGAGGSAGKVSVTTNGSLTTTGANSDGILAQSLGGGGGNGGFSIAASAGQVAVSVGIGGSGGAGGGASSVTVDGHGAITTTGSNSLGIAAQSIGGGGGNGGFSGSGSIGLTSVSVGVGGSGGSGGAAGSVSVANSGNIHTQGSNATGIAAQSIGGGGGNGGFAGTGAITLAGGANVGVGGSGGTGGTADSAFAQQSGSLWTQSANSTGILAQSIGGGGGNGGFSAGGSIGAGGAISVTVGGNGGGGQNASTATVVIDGNDQSVPNVGYGGGWNTMTRGANSAGVVAQSIGGGGGNGGFSAGAALSGGYSLGVAIGGTGAGGGDAATAKVYNGYTYANGVYTAGSNNILTTGDLSAGIIAQSIGGGGGNGGFAGALSGSIGAGGAGAFTLGGSGGAGGLGRVVDVYSIGDIHTVGNYSDGIMAQSIGGSGGNGGMSIAVSATTSTFGGAVAIGGTGGAGNDANTVTLSSTGDIVTEGIMSNGLFAQSIGGGGGNGGVAGSGAISFGVAASVSVGGQGKGGGSGSTVTLTNNGAIRTAGDQSSAIIAQSVGGGGGNGGGSIGVAIGAAGLGVAVGGNAGAGGNALDVTVTSTGNLTTGYGATPTRGTSNAFGILAQSIGGGGGTGGYAGTVSLGVAAAASVSVGGTGGAGGSAGKVGVTSTGDISTVYDNSAGIMAQSIGGGGGNGGFSFAVSASGAIEDIGGAVSVAVGGSGGVAGKSDTVTVLSTGDIWTRGDNSAGIVAQSIGGGGGNGGWSVGASASLGLVSAGVSVGGFGSGGGAGEAVDVKSYGAAGMVLQSGTTLETDGELSDGILAQSLGGGGGNGGWSVAAGGALGGGGIGVSVGGFGAGGGNAQVVTVESYNDIVTRGMQSNGIAAQSLGGGGGNGGFSVAAGAGSEVGGAVSVGGFALGGGGSAQGVTVTSVGTISTYGNQSNGILAQSIGGGGGNGGFSASGDFSAGAVGLGASVGGQGSVGGTSDFVRVYSYGAGVDVVPTSTAATIYTEGAQSNGILAQSIGGGGGNGGFAVSGGISTGGPAINVSVGGFGSGGGTSGAVTVESYNNIWTRGAFANGISAQSIGGGGGNGGFSASAAGSSEVAAQIGVGGFGGGAGDGKIVSVTSYGHMLTEGVNANGILAQSIGGGGGNGGFAVGGTFSGGPTGITANVGGFGAGGGSAEAVTVSSYGNGYQTAPPADTLTIQTIGAFSNGILAQSIGGGGGNGGFAVGGGFSPEGGPVTVSVGGFALSGGGNAGAVTVESYNNIQTSGFQANGIAAQSLGGGGGNGGFAVGASAGGDFAATATVGGFGSGGGTAQKVQVTSVGTLQTGGDNADGILAQSLGGGGGNGGFALAGAFTLGQAGVSASVGGKGGDGAKAGEVLVSSNVGQTLGNTATISTVGKNANGIAAQSIGGGGGNGGFSGALTGTAGAKASISLSVGGFGGTGDIAEHVGVTSVDNIVTQGDFSNGILAQSIGGGGGNGGFSFAGTVAIPEGKSLSLAASLGGFGGSGEDAGTVSVDSTGAIQTNGNNANGVVAQSLGGGGGNGGVSVAGTFNFASENKVPSITASVGGFGGSGGTGMEVTVIRNGATTTIGDKSNGILAQSIGGSGGNGGMSIAGSLGGADTKQISASVGGFGGDGSTAAAVTVTNTGNITTGSVTTVQQLLAIDGEAQFVSAKVSTGADSNGILAQSIGGGGGNGGFAFSGSIGLTGENTSIQVGATVGGFGGSGGTAGNVTVTDTGDIVTLGDRANGISAQSIGGGGGNGGSALTGLIAAGDPQAGGRAVNVAVSVGGFGGNGNLAGTVHVEQTGSITTYGAGSNGILAQSIGGGGGTGGGADSLSLQLGSSCTQKFLSKLSESCQAPKKASINVQVDVGGFGGTGNDAQTVTVLNHGAITTHGDSSVGILAQSIGGGGGNGGQAIVGLAGTFPGAQYVDYGTTVIGLAFGTTGLAQGLGKVTVGGFGGASGQGGEVDVTNGGVIQTSGTSSHGIFAQSVGGGGGVGGNASSGVTGLVSVGGFGGGSGDGGVVTVINVAGGDITTTGDHSDAILAQSVGGGGGEGNISGNNGTIDPTKQSASADIVNGQNITYPATATNDGTVAGNGGSASGLLALGGFGGASGSGGTVTVTNAALLSTSGDYSAGIVAQSIGGGGGDGGGTGLSGIAVGGFAGVLGAATGQGGDVTVTNNAVAPDANTATIYTKGQSAYGILAQSVGGSGGSGGGNSLAAAVTVGGFGGNAGDGGHVQVFNHGAIGTEGTGAVGILAQSVGGSGGTGGGAVVSLVTVGGRGGSGGKGGEVDVTNTATVQTKGAGASAVFAQSVGGGGGTGGGTASGAAANVGLLVSVGGQGEGGGIGGTVTVDNSGQLLTKGDKSYGVYAQSIGGGGGDGGMAIGLIAVGGSSSLASDGGNVTVTNEAGALIETHGLMADAIFAQSVGGGGGNGGGAWSGSPVGISASVGGTGGGGGKGGVVTVDNSAGIVTYGGDTEAIFAQSVGGGGGNGGMAMSFNFQGIPVTPAAAVSVGGSGGTGGNGGEVTVTNHTGGSITTNGANSTGIFAQSVGGGGGNGGYALTVSASLLGSAGVSVGGSGGAAGDGGKVTVTNDGMIVLNGNNNLGIMAQSVGGGGGVASDALGIGVVPVSIGGTDGATGKGGDVKVVNSGTIVINGDNSAGLFAQSVGGGGGMVKPGGGAAAVTLASGGSGDGGTVTIINSGEIIVTGANSAALFAQSVGGGGGVVGLQTDPPGQTGPFLFAGTAGGLGAAAAITIDQSNSLVATGENSIALVAQSSSAGGNGDITVNITSPHGPSNLTLIEGGSGQGAGVFIRDGANNTLNNGGYLTSVLGVDGYAVRATTGDDNVVNTAVMVGSVDLGSGANALTNEAGALFNSGTIVNLGAGNLMTNNGLLSPGAFQNVMTTSVTGNFTQTTGAYYGLDLQLASNTTDKVVVSGSANVQGTVVISVMSPGLAQSGTHENTIVHADGGISGHDGLTLAYVPTAVTTYSLVYPNADDVDLNYVINYSPTGLTQNQHSLGNAVNAIQAMPTTNAFTPIAAALFYQPTVKQLGAVYDSLSGEGVAGAQQPAFTAADRFVSVIGQQMNFWMSGEGFDGNGVIYTEKRPAGPLAYAEVPRTPSPFGALPSARPVEPAPFWRLWASGFGGNGSLKGDAETGSADLRYRGTGAAMGVEYHPTAAAMIGASLGGSQSVFGVDDRATSGHFDAAHLGLYGAWRDEHLYLQGTAAFSTFDNRYERHALIPGISLGSLGGVVIPDVAGFDERLKGAFNSRIFGGRLEAGWRVHAAPGIDVSPFAAVQLSRLETDDFTEQQTSGKASQIGLSYARRVIPSLPIFLGTQIDGRVAFDNGMELHSWVRAAWVHEFDPNRSVDPSFIAAPGYDFIIQGARAAADSARIDGGLQLKMSRDVSLFGNASADLSGVGHTFTAGGGLRISW